jgi:cytochrome P450
MNKFIENELEHRFAERQRDKDSSDTDFRPSKSVVSLALESYMSEHMQGTRTKEMDKTFKAYATAQIRLFLFAGHDTTSSTLCYCYHLLSSHPKAMATLRAEHDRVFGTDLSKVPSLLMDNSHLLNQVPYTLAVTKETMRLFPAASSMREGSAGVHITDDTGNNYPTEGVYVWVLHLAIQRNPKYWKDPDSFIPGRWLVGPDDPLYPVKGAWRPFEFGPRNCIGQTLVTMDIRTVLVMTVREFEIRAAYQEWDDLHPRKAVKTVRGERAYQIEKGGAHPADGFPCRVTLRK